MLVAELFCLIEQVLTEEVSFDLDFAIGVGIVLARLVVSTEFVFFFNLLNYTSLTIFLLGSWHHFLTCADLAQ